MLYYKFCFLDIRKAAQSHTIDTSNNKIFVN